MLIGAARKIWLWSPMRRQAIYDARIGKKPGQVLCASCSKVMEEKPEKPKRKEYQVDHTVPASETAKVIQSWDDFLARLFVASSGLKILCKSCHDGKTKKENEQRRDSKRTLGRVPSKKKRAKRRCS